MSTYASSNWRDASTAWNSLIAAATEAARGAAKEFGPQDRTDQDRGHRGRESGHGHEHAREHGHEHGADRGRDRSHQHGKRRRRDHEGGRPGGFDRSEGGPGFPFGPGGLFGPPGGPGHGPGHGHGGPGFGPTSGPWRARGRGRGRGGRRRGDVRSAILVLLDEQPRHGYELISEIRERSGGVWRPSPGTVYPTLSQLEDEGLIKIESLDGRKTATLTDEGRAYVEENRAQLGTPWTEVAGDVRAENRTLAGVIAQLGMAASTVALHGTPAQATAAAEILDRARQELYSLMAEPQVSDQPAAGDTSPTDDSGESEDATPE